MVAAYLLQSFLEQSVLNDYQFDILLEAFTTQIGRLLSVEGRNIGYVEVRVFFELLGYGIDYLCFFFPCHCP